MTENESQMLTQACFIKAVICRVILVARVSTQSSAEHMTTHEAMPAAAQPKPACEAEAEAAIENQCAVAPPSSPPPASACKPNGACEKSSTPVKSVAKAKRLPRPKLDYDVELEKITQSARDAKKVLKAHMAEKRNAARRKSRLVRKASKLPTDDLYRIAVLKRCGNLDAFFATQNTTIEDTPEELTPEQRAKVVERLQKLLGSKVSCDIHAEDQSTTSSSSAVPLHASKKLKKAEDDAQVETESKTDDEDEGENEDDPKEDDEKQSTQQEEDE